MQRRRSTSAEAGAMDFFAHQEAARRKTRWLLALVFLAICGLSGALYLPWVLAEALRSGRFTLVWWQPSLACAAFGVTASFVLIASGLRLLSLRRGGASVAEMLGGELVPAGSSDPARRRLLNVVEEMAIASGMPVPEVYLLDDTAINAFAAGLGPSDAVIGITRGALEQLERDALQGVIAHEFSHILHGDARLNLRLMALVFGMLCIALAGSFLLKLVDLQGRRRYRHGSSGGDAAFFLIGAGLSLWLVGSLGRLCTLLIKAAVSRQREYLADAAAVQFTRETTGLARALRRIAEGSGSSVLRSPRAEEASHMFFGDGCAHLLELPWLATHPPLTDRIARLEGAQPAGLARLSAHGSALANMSALSSFHQPPSHQGAATLTQHAGRLDARSLGLAALRLAELPPALRDASRHTLSAQALLLHLLSPQPSQQACLQGMRLPLPLREELDRLRRAVPAVAPEHRLAATELASPALRQLSPAQRQVFIHQLERLIAADGALHPFEFAISYTLRKQLADMQQAPSRRLRFRHPAGLRDALALLLSVMAQVGTSKDAARAQAAYEAARRTLSDADLGPRPLPYSETLLRGLDIALAECGAASFRLRKRILEACTIAVLHDDALTVAEGELLRVTAAALELPIALA